MRYSYDLVNNLVAVEDARGIEMRLSYDKLNRITGVRYPTSTENVEYRWDNCAYVKGRLCGPKTEKL